VAEDTAARHGVDRQPDCRKEQESDHQRQLGQALIDRGRRLGAGAGLALAHRAVVVTLGVAFPTVIRPKLIERKADKALMAMPAFQQIAKWEPASYNQMKAEMIGSLERDESSVQAQGRIRARVQKVSKQYMRTASDDSLIAYISVTVEEIKQVNAKDPAVAFGMLFGGKTDVDVTKYIDDATQKKDAEALAEIIHTGVAKEAGSQNDQKATQMLRDVVAGMRRDFGPDAELPFNPKATGPDAASQRRTCEMTVEFYNRILALRSDQSAQVLRLLLASAG